MKAPGKYSPLTGFLVLVLVLLPRAAELRAQEIEHFNRQLGKELERSGIPSFSLLKEIDLPDPYKAELGESGSYFRLEGDQEVTYLYSGRVYSCRSGGCSLKPAGADKAGAEYFDYFILFDRQHRVLQVRVHAYHATRGQEVCSRGWLKQFRGYDGSQGLRVGKEVDGISGATISVQNLVQDVEHKTRLLTRIL